MSVLTVIILLSQFSLQKADNFNTHLKNIGVHQLAPLHRHDVVHKLGLLNGNPFNQNADNSPIIYITDYNGDPYGINDSTLAFKLAINESITHGAPNTNLSNGIKDLGGVTIDLQGGDYLISEPITIPPMVGNLRLIHGTIRASDKFPKQEYLLSIGDVNYDCSNQQGSCNENIAIENIMLDCKQNCYGALHVIDTMGTVIGPQIFVLGYNDVGIRLNKGHEAMIFNAWLGEYLYSDNRKTKATANSIQIDGPDNYVTNTIIFAGRNGVVVNGPANIIEGVHCWNLMTRDNGTGILLGSTTSKVRLINNYMDYTDMVLVAPITTITVHDTFFIGGGTFRLVANAPGSTIHSLDFRSSSYSIAKYNGNMTTVVLDESNGNKFMTVENCIMDGFQIFDNSYILKTTSAERTLTLTNSTKWVFNFNDVLLFEHVAINKFYYTLKLEGSSKNEFIQHSATTLSDNKNDDNSRIVTITTNTLCDATVYITVDQSL